MAVFIHLHEVESIQNFLDFHVGDLELRIVDEFAQCGVSALVFELLGDFHGLQAQIEDQPGCVSTNFLKWVEIDKIPVENYSVFSCEVRLDSFFTWVLEISIVGVESTF